MLQLLFGILMTWLFFLSLRSVQAGRLELRDALVWILLAGGGMVLAIFPQLLFLTRRLGFEVESNAILSLGIVVLLFLNFLQATSLAKVQRDLRQLAQAEALRNARKP